MKIGVISDTHARTIDEVPRAILKALETVDVIVHAGDFTEKAVLDGLAAIGQVKAVSVNMDSLELKRILPRTELFTVGGNKIGVAHGSGGPWKIADRVRELFTDADISSLVIPMSLVTDTFVGLSYLTLGQLGIRLGW